MHGNFDGGEEKLPQTMNKLQLKSKVFD